MSYFHHGVAAFAGYLIKATINDKKVNPKFVYYHTLGRHYELWKDSIFNQATIQNIGADKYSNLVISYPNNLQEQNEIVRYLDEKCFEVNKKVCYSEQIILKLAEYKKSLIYEVVTGKREV